VYFFTTVDIMSLVLVKFKYSWESINSYMIVYRVQNFEITILVKESVCRMKGNPMQKKL